jgi:hypothetical protein
VDTLHLTTPGVEKKNDHVIANVPIPINAEQPVRPMTLFGSIKVFDHDVLLSPVVPQSKLAPTSGQME